MSDTRSDQAQASTPGIGRCWIFQANPDAFDIERFLQPRPSSFLWLVQRYGSEIAIGDQVFLWRAIGSNTKERTKSGIVAEAEVIGPVTTVPEDASSIPFWHDPTDAAQPRPRVRLRLRRVSQGRKEIIQRDWLEHDPLLNDLLVLRMRTGTNYPVEHDHALRLNALWQRTGQDWNYAESVAGLWAYTQTLGGSISRLAGSPVANVALRIGRATTGVYNKVMNYRHLDPRDTRAGLSGGGDMDGQVWRKFYAKGVILLDDLNREYERLWAIAPTSLPVEETGAANDLVKREAARLIDLTVEELLERCSRSDGSPAAPSTKVAATRRYDRSPIVVAYALVRAQFRCEVPDCRNEVFVDEGGLPFMEVHHIQPLNEGGVDKPENVACVCANHHREAHHGRRARDIKLVLSALRALERHGHPASAGHSADDAAHRGEITVNKSQLEVGEGEPGHAGPETR
jgi:hypothetical protein